MRSTAPALFAGGWALQQLWQFWVAPIAGAATAGFVYRWLSPDAPHAWKCRACTDHAASWKIKCFATAKVGLPAREFPKSDVSRFLGDGRAHTVLAASMRLAAFRRARLG
jgi:hypothetical protein